MRRFAAVGVLLLLGFLGTGEAADAPGFDVRIDARILRKTVGKLVLSLSSFEMGKDRTVRLANRRTGEQAEIGLSSIYWDISYTDPLPQELYDRLVEEEWIPFVVWSIPDTMDGLRDRLAAIYDYQNLLRRELGHASLDGDDSDVRISSRLTLNKIEKFHRIAAVIARRYMMRAREKDELNTFLYPLRIQIGFNPFGAHFPASRLTPLQLVRDAIYWEVHRVLTQQFAIEEGLVDFIFNAPTTERYFIPVIDPENPGDFYPSVTLTGDSIDCAIYLQRQGFDREVGLLLREKLFLDPFITDRLVVDHVINEGHVLGVYGNKAAVTFIPPFMTRNEKVFISTGEGQEEIPVVLAAPIVDGGYTITTEIPGPQAARIRPGMPVRRK